MGEGMTQRVLQEAADWVWIPADAEDYIGPDYRLTVYPDRTSVQWSATTRPLVEVITEVRARARAAGRSPLRWWVNGRTAPPETPIVLQEHGLRLVEVVDVLARGLIDVEDLDVALAVPDDVKVRPADDADTIRLAGDIGGRSFGWPPPTPRQLADEIQALDEAHTSGRWLTRRYVAYIKDEPVGSAGCTLAGTTLRLWGGGVLPAARRRGAYRALLAARCVAGAQQGATLALVKGRTDTSAPVLRRAGFITYASERCFEEPVGAAAD